MPIVLFSIVYKYTRLFFLSFFHATAYECHGSWDENGIGFLIASPLSRSSTTARRYCFSYSETDEGLQVYSSSDSCLRDGSPNLEGIWAFNLTVDGKVSLSLSKHKTVPLLSKHIYLPSNDTEFTPILHKTLYLFPSSQKKSKSMQTTTATQLVCLC